MTWPVAAFLILWHAVDPASGEQKKGDLAGIWCFGVFCNKTNYEIAYRIYEEDGQLVVVILAGTRENFYEDYRGFGGWSHRLAGW